MDNLAAFIKRIYDGLPTFHAEMAPTDWKAFGEDLIRLQPVVDDDGADEKRRIVAFYELYETCSKYEPIRRLLPSDPTKLAGPPQPRPKDEVVTGLDDEPCRNRVSDIIERMKEIDSPKPAQPGPPKQAGERA
jgi:hypothetical protein